MLESEELPRSPQFVQQLPALLAAVCAVKEVGGERYFRVDDELVSACLLVKADRAAEARTRSARLSACPLARRRQHAVGGWRSEADLRCIAVPRLRADTSHAPALPLPRSVSDSGN